MRPASILIHFFDIHVVSAGDQRRDPFVDKARIALRSALFCADEVVVPASSLLESEVCWTLVQELASANCLLTFCGGDSGFGEFCDAKLLQYPSKSPQYLLYKAHQAHCNDFQYRRRKHNTTSDIRASWLTEPAVKDAYDRIRRMGHNSFTARQFEKAWRSAPEKLGTNAFIPDHIELGIPNDRSILSVTKDVINAAYFQSYSTEATGGIVRNIPLGIGVDQFFPVPPHGIDYKRVMIWLSTHPGFRRRFCELSGEQLIELRESEEGISFVTAILSDPKFRATQQVDQYYRRAIHTSNEGRPRMGSPELPPTSPTPLLQLKLVTGEDASSQVRDIRESIHNGKLIVFCGNGISQQSDVRPKMPTWHSLLNRLQEVAIQNGILASSECTEIGTTSPTHVLLSELGKVRTALDQSHQFSDAIRSIFAPTDKTPGAVHNTIARSQVRMVLTTNYDTFLETPASDRLLRTWIDSDSVLADMREGRRILLKAHGCALTPKNIILSKEDHAKLAGNASYQQLMRTIFSEHRVLFVGYGMNDPYDLDPVLSSMKDWMASTQKNWVLDVRTNETSSRRYAERMLTSFNSIALTYSSFDDLPEIVESLLSD